VGALAIAVVGMGEWNAFLRRLGGQELGQVLTTMGFALIFQDLGLIIWGGDPYTIPGIRESESRMRTLGYHVWLHKYIGFVIAGGVGGSSSCASGGFGRS
jgi:branched-subunit amino acid ABC-type transport system permease component